MKAKTEKEVNGEREKKHSVYSGATRKCSTMLTNI